MKIVILDGFLVNSGDISWAPIEKFGKLTVYDTTPPESVLERIMGADIVLTNRTKISSEVLQKTDKLQYIGCFGTGYNHIDLLEAKKRGVTVCNVPSYSTTSVAQATIGLLMEIVQPTSSLSCYVKSGNWKNEMDPMIAEKEIIELHGKTFGIIGMGEIGCAVGKIAKAFGMRIIGCSRNAGGVREKEGIELVAMDRMLAQADIISIHTPLTKETAGMVNKDFLSKVKDGAILLNTARGGILDENAVVEALDSGKLYFVGADVLSCEPAGRENPLVKHPKTIITPHIGWAAKKTRERLIGMVSENIENFILGKPSNNVL